MTSKDDLFTSMTTASFMNVDELMKEVLSKIPSNLYDSAIPALSALTDTDAWSQLKDLIGKDAEDAGLIALIDANDIYKFFVLRMLTQKVIAPLVTEVLSLKTMVRTLTVSKEVSQ